MEYDSEIPLRGICPKEVKAGTETYLCSDILSNFIHNGQKVEMTQVFAGG